MILIEFLVFLLKVLGLAFLVGIILNLLIDVIIINPIENRIMQKKRQELFDVIIERIKNGEDIEIEKIHEEADEKIEK